MGIISPTPTAYAWQAIDYVLTQSWAKAEELSNDYYDLYYSPVYTYLSSADINMAGPASVATDVTVTEPGVLIPEEAAGIDTSFYDAMVNDAIDKLSGLFSTYITTYFPVDNTTNSQTEAWLQQALTTGGTGIDPTLEAQYWENDRSRILAEANRASDEATAVWASRRFPLPPGALAGIVATINSKATEELSKSSRSIAIKQAEIELENVKFAVEQAIKLREVALSTASEYIKSLASSITVAQNLAVSQADAQNGLINAAANFYNARINAKELFLKRDSADAEFEQEKYKQDLNADIAVMQERVKAALAGAQSIAHQAAAALNNLHANVSGGISNSFNDSVGYNYAGDVNADVSPKTST
jgi:hypothetical protein